MTVQASSFNVPFEALFDRTAWLKAHVGTIYVVNVYNYTFNTTATAPGVDQFNGFSSTSWTKPGSGGLVDIPNVQNGDTLVIDCTYGWSQVNIGASELRLYFIQDPTGTPVELSGGIPGTRVYHEAKEANEYQRGSITKSHVASMTGTFTARVGIEAIVATGKSLNIQSSLSIRVIHMRTS